MKVSPGGKRGGERYIRWILVIYEVKVVVQIGSVACFAFAARLCLNA